MDTLETLRKRIATTEDLQSIVGTMKALSAVSIRQYEEAVAALRSWAEPHALDPATGLVVAGGIVLALALRPDPAPRVNGDFEPGRFVGRVEGVVP